MITNEQKRNIEKIFLISNKIMLLFIMLCMILLLTLYIASAEVSIMSYDMPTEISENEALEISFEAFSDSGSTISYRIYRDGILVSNTSSFSETLNYSSSGIYDFSLVAQDNETSDIENGSLTVIDTPLTIDILIPVDSTYTTSYINITASTSRADSECAYSVDNQSFSMMAFDDERSTFYRMHNFPDGGYLLIVTCNDSFDHSSTNRTFMINTSLPIIASKSYSINANYEAHISIVTSIVSQCRYDSSDRSFNEMRNRMNDNNGISHTAIISSLSEGKYEYFVRCRDLNGYAMQTSESMMFSIDKKPEASISINKNPPLKAGTYEVTVSLSEPVQSLTLQYGFNNDNSLKNVPITGSGKNYKGYIIIEDSTSNKVGFFKFTATDISGNQGSKINTGEVFLVDTVDPVAVQSFEAVALGEYIALKWYYNGGDARKFNIYRSDTPGVEYTDLINSADNKNSAAGEYTYDFVDKSVSPGIAYYYRLSAVDEAGNEGPLSDEVSDSAEDESSHQSSDQSSDVPEEIKQLDKSLVGDVNDIISLINKKIMDIESRKKTLNSISDPVKIRIINILKLNEKISNAISSLNNALAEAESLKSQNLKKSELDVKINKLRLDSIKAESEVIEDLQIIEYGDYEQYTQESDIYSAVSSITDGLNLTKKALSAYISENKRLQDLVTVTSESISFRIKFLGKDDYETKTLIIKKLILNAAINDTILVESIPKDVEQKVDLVSFLTPDVIVLNDNAVQLKIQNANSQLLYIINDNIELSSIKNTRTVLLNKPRAYYSSGDNEITGFVSYDSINLGNINPMNMFLFLGIAIIIGLSVYYVKLEYYPSREIRRVNHTPSNIAKGRNYASVTERRILNHGTRMKTSNLQNNLNTTLNTTLNNTLNTTLNTTLNGNPNANLNTSDKLSNIKIIQGHNNRFIKSQPNRQGFNTVKKSVMADNDCIMTPADLIWTNIEKSNSLINSLDYESARSTYNSFIRKVRASGIENPEDMWKMVLHVRMKLDSYRLIHSARKHLYYNEIDKFDNALKSLDKLYSDLAYNVGFMNSNNVSEEIRYLQFIADSKRQFSDHYIKRRSL